MEELKKLIIQQILAINEERLLRYIYVLVNEMHSRQNKDKKNE